MHPDAGVKTQFAQPLSNLKISQLIEEKKYAIDTLNQVVILNSTDTLQTCLGRFSAYKINAAPVKCTYQGQVTYRMVDIFDIVCAFIQQRQQGTQKNLLAEPIASFCNLSTNNPYASVDKNMTLLDVLNIFGRGLKRVHIIDPPDQVPIVSLVIWTFCEYWMPRQPSFLCLFERSKH